MGDTDSLNLAHHYFHSLILAIIQEEEAKERASFKYVSFEWIGKPGWYFWPKERQGVYYLKLEKAQQNKKILEASFELYYYPHPEEMVFESFSLIEQMVRVSDLFSQKGVQFTTSCPLHAHEDHHCQENFQDLKEGKGIPTIEARERLNAYLYRLGEISFYWDTTRLHSCVIDSQIYSRTWTINDLVFPGEGGDIRVVSKARNIDRDLPSWELVRFFSEKFFLDLGVSWRVTAEQDIGEPAVKTMSICFVH